MESFSLLQAETQIGLLSCGSCYTELSQVIPLQFHDAPDIWTLMISDFSALIATVPADELAQATTGRKPSSLLLNSVGELNGVPARLVYVNVKYTIQSTISALHRGT